MTPEKFWASVAIGPVADCWPWLGGTNCAKDPEQRRGRIHHNGRAVYAYRFAWELHNGKSLDGLVARHSCDNPICVNPHHILPGTQRDNVRDAVERGRIRNNPRYGMDHHITTVTPDRIGAAVREWLEGSERQQDVAARYGISQTTLSRWARGAVRPDSGIQGATDFVKLKPCGTHAAYARHIRRGEKACAECLQAEREHCAMQRAKRQQAAA